MTETLKMERETCWVSMTTGEVFENQAEAVKAYSDGDTLMVLYRTRYNDGDWYDWVDGPQWVH